ncbi:MAG: hypothetical protein U0172_04705 [Nitrospiraceae bacterium]
MRTPLTTLGQTVDSTTIERRPPLRSVLTFCLAASLCLVVGCSSSKKVVPLVPLPLDARASQQAVSLNEGGAAAYEAKQFPEAKALFEQAVAAAPEVGAARYNLALALNALGETQAAHDQFLEAATLEPGNKVIWDSPALRPYGNPEATKSASSVPSNPNRRSAAGMGGYGGGGMGGMR